ncbi:MAG: M14 family zinc carboxypeptidase, partial [Bacteroidota bacterium]
MKQILCALCLFLSICSFAQNDYYFPKGAQFNPDIPSPEAFLGYPVGDFHTRHDRVVAYFETLARLSPNASFQIIGHTNEMRPQVVLTISDEENMTQLENIRQAHLNLAKAGNTEKSDHVIVLLGYNVHGNEPSSTEAAMLTAYYLLAEQSKATKNYLKTAVIHIDPVYNPDGRDRHSHWANMHRAQPLVSDPQDAEHNEAWPRGRTNHYWFDLNRDWLPLAQVESRNRVAFYHQWLPNVATDYHEMGTNATYFFEPTEHYGAENPLVPRDNYDKLNELFAGYFAKAMDQIGSLYYSGESFDNSYPGYGSTYPDMQGGLGLLFEQA